MIVPLLALLVIVVLALLIVQLGSNALVLTGMSQAAARFQASSAFFGVGFTTLEAEMVVDHPVRRRIILHLIISGNIGLTSALATLIVTMTRNDPDGLPLGLLLFLIIGGAVAFGLLMNVGWIKRPLDAVMKRSLKMVGVIEALDYEVLLNLKEGFSVSEVEVEAGHPFANKALMESRPSDHGVVVLGIHHKRGAFVGAPDKNERIEPGDVIMIYGADEVVKRTGSGRLLDQE
ncbi:TrkA C-terminal domain-containing protein [Haloferula sp.]|uniref:TrkA C-terminal domain-containing protein n=1 Tax=Haloferula sp. TaxID=2497595 RepID=UPI003C732002